MPLHLSESEIVDRASLLPAFPQIVNEILLTLDDDGSALKNLSQLVERDPVITARILSIANSVALGGRSERDIRDMRLAISLIGLARMREIVLGVSLAEFSRETRVSHHFWAHSVAVGVAAQELARQAHLPGDLAFVCGLLHDIGHLWMARFYPLEFQMVQICLQTEEGAHLLDAERRYFGIDHCAIGRILAVAWHLPTSVVAAIQHHHDASPPADKLVAATHVAEAIANALDLTRHDAARVTELSEQACDLLDIDWQDDLSPLFGRIEARSQYLCSQFR